MDWESATKRNYHATLVLGIIWIVVGILQLDLADGQAFRTLFGFVMLLAGAVLSLLPIVCASTTQSSS